MKILLISVGTNGDIEPFLAIAELLKEKGHDIVCCFPEQFRTITKEANHHFVGLGAEFLELLESVNGKIVMGGRASIIRKIKAYYSLYQKSSLVNKILVKQQQDLINDITPDKVIYNIKSLYPLIWTIDNPEKAILVSPIPYLVHSTKNQAHIGFNKNFGSIINKLTYRLSNYGLIKNVLSVTKDCASIKKITFKQLKKVLCNSKMIYTVSPSLFTRPNYWPTNVQILGFHERNKRNTWEANDELKAFISKHDKILFVTLGSMTNENPEEKTAIVLDIVQRYGIPTIINTSSGGLMKPNSYESNLLLFVSNIPYDWIFSKVYAVMHHGGSGTTHTSLKYGCSSLIIPHIIDQFMWRNAVYDLGVGPRGIDISKLNLKTLEPLILNLYQNAVYKERAKQISEQMKKEKLKKELYQFIMN
ncbi:glycosyltransferase [Muriicola sp. Z0-33]|uniref:glycosyltransferase n=1 Tax=Muriicola sp. Z0-33 TaxID=2816957 RepID=UPI002237A4B8|nr:nucleotide disphospho-sugar-binding domain-containing protein [Muriicola sp. Z0-33]MCW5518109.1 glycosyltransferase [Muriicola sp. Z0-33]